MTENGYDMVIDRIKSKHVNPPTHLTPQEFNVWAQAYCDGVQDAVDAVEELKEEMIQLK